MKKGTRILVGVVALLLIMGVGAVKVIDTVKSNNVVAVDPPTAHPW